jgi:hypothetical protein
VFDRNQEQKSWGGFVNRRVLGLVASVAISLCCSAQAATLCSSTPIRDIDTSDVSFNGLNATECFGVVVGLNNAGNIGFDGFTPLLSNALPGGVAVTGSLEGIDFSLAASGLDIGSWSLAWSGAEAPVTLDIVAVVQTALTFSSYFFDDVVFALSPASGKGTWMINYRVNEDIPILSAFSIYARDFRGDTTTPPPTPNPVDEPSTLVLFGLAAIGLARARRRTKKQA